MSTTLPPFDIRGPLPAGTTLLEASAGTGKTWTIAALVTRYVAEGRVPLEQLLIVTFGRAASQELRERVRGQLVEAEHALGGEPVEGSDLIDLLLDCPPAEREQRRRNITKALASFDAATIATTHQFCRLVLASLGVAGDSDSGAELVEDLDDLTVQVVDDLYLRAFAGQEPVFSYATALEIARAAVADPQARLEPGETAQPLAARRVSFARAVRAELDRRKRRLGVLSYDDLLSQVADALADPEGPARTRLRQRWQVVLVDEFQDTDPVQWAVLDRAFSGHATLVLIGDPKQAIYAFRGGDVATYLQAAATAQTRQTLQVNRRSDAALLGSLQAVLRGAALGEGITVHEVEAAHDGSRLAGAPDGTPFRLKVVRREDLGSANRLPAIAAVRALIADDLARDIRALFDARPTFAERPGEERPLLPRDVAVIAPRHADLAAVQAALARVGVPAVIAGGGSVFATPSALEWLTLLEGIEQPHRADRVRAAALTAFVGLGAAELDAGGDRLTDELATRMRAWAELVATRGVAAVLEVASAEGLSARVLAEVGGERHLTDLRHVGEVLHDIALQERFGVVSLVAWLRTQIGEARAGRGAERTRRLDSDAAAVQLVTVHASKGLQYPVVYLPALADRHVPKPQLPLFHNADGHRCLDVGAGGEEWAAHVATALAEEAGEALRLLYVAATRAQSQVVAWWAPSKNAEASALHRLMLGRTPGVEVVPDELRVPTDDQALETFRKWQAVGGPKPEPVGGYGDPPARPAPEPAGLTVRTFARLVDTGWRRTSYSALTRVELPATVTGSEPELVVKDDEEMTPAHTPDEGAGADVVSPMAGLPVGATFGSLVHGVLEVADWQAEDLAAELTARVEEQLVLWPVDLDRDELVAALVAVTESPLGPLVGDLRLRDIALRDRLAELEFELPLAGGERPVAGEVTLGDLAPLLRQHLPEGDPVRGYADALDHPLLGGQPLRGYLTGSIDVALRVHAEDGPRYVVIDYKTNWLGDAPAGELTAHDYRPEALEAAMGHSDYPLQALLYAVVLHRFLRWRQPGYQPDRHLGGVLYLYLRGMCGAQTPMVDGQPCGVFAWRPPVALVEALSDLLDGDRSAVAHG